MPRDYIPIELDRRVRDAAKHRCGYCLRRGESVAQLFADPATGVEAALFNPRTQRWSEHFQWTDDRLRMVGLTETGRATVALLHLDDDPDAIEVRSHWVAAGWHPPTDD